jgi:NADPH2:quinone reductase
VGHAAIELARWSGATVIASVSSPEKAALAAAAGAHHVVNYRTEDAPQAVRRVAPKGIDVIVEVAAAANAALDASVIGPNGTVAIYASDHPGDVAIQAGPAMRGNTRYQFVLVYTVSPQVKQHAVRDVQAAVAAGALRVGEEVGLPLHRFPLERTADAHAAVEGGAVGKVLIDV